MLFGRTLKNWYGFCGSGTVEKASRKVNDDLFSMKIFVTAFEPKVIADIVSLLSYVQRFP